MKTELRKELETVSAWTTGDRAPDRVESYQGRIGSSHFTVLRWRLEDGQTGWDGTYSYSRAGHTMRLTPEIAEYGWLLARASWVKSLLSPVLRIWYESAVEVIGQDPMTLRAKTATRHLQRVIEHVVLLGHDYDDGYVKHLITRACAELGVSCDG